MISHIYTIGNVFTFILVVMQVRKPYKQFVINPKKAIIPIHKEELGLMEKLDMDIHCPIVESTQVVDGINIIIK